MTATEPVLDGLESRSAWAAAKLTALNPELLRYLSRLSDLLFVMARWLARRDGGQETLWRR